MTATAPAFQFYPKDWLDFRVQRMCLAAQGAYMKMLCFMWADSPDQCSLVDDDNQLARAIGITVEQWLELRGEIQCEADPIFGQKEGRLISKRLREEATKQRKYRKLQSDKGKRSAERRLNRGSTAVEPVHQPEGHSLSSSSLKKKKSPLHTPLQLERFERFWEIYPARDGKKIGKAEALAYFSDLNEADQELLLLAVENFAASRRVQEGFGIMDPVRFIRKLKPIKSEPWREWIEPEKQAPSGQELRDPSSRKQFTEVAL